MKEQMDQQLQPYEEILKLAKDVQFEETNDLYILLNKIRDIHGLLPIQEDSYDDAEYYCMYEFDPDPCAGHVEAVSWDWNVNDGFGGDEYPIPVCEKHRARYEQENPWW